MRLSFLLLTFTLLLGCEPKHPPVRIVTNPWPGYELLHLAEQLGYFEDAKLNLQLVQMNSLADAYRAYLIGHVDGFTSTMVEVVQSQLQGAPALKVVMLTDYSSGGDLIITRKEIPTLQGLKGKKVGCEMSALGIVVLTKALASQGLSIRDVTVVNVEQLAGVVALQKGEIDAFVTYPPASVKLLQQPEFHSVFTSREIPGGILDVLSVSRKTLEQQPDIQQKLEIVWQRAYDYAQQHPEDAFQRMAKRENISPAEFAAIFQNDMHIYTRDEMHQGLRSNNKIDEEVLNICNVLKALNQHQKACEQLPSVQH